MSEQQISELKVIVNKAIVVMFLITQKQYGLQTEAATERSSSKAAIPELINAAKRYICSKEHPSPHCLHLNLII